MFIYLELWPMQSAAREVPLVELCEHREVIPVTELTNISLLSSPILPNRYVLPSQRMSSKETAETNEECP